MSWKRTVRCVVFMLFLSMLAGCSGEPDGRVGQETPQAVMSKFTTALLDGDKQGFVECFTQPEPCRAYAGSAYDAMRATTILSDALEQKHGDRAWDTFVWSAREISHELILNGLRGGLYYHPVIWKEESFLDKLRYQERDDTIRVNYSGVGFTGWTLVKKGDVYCIDPTKVFKRKGLGSQAEKNEAIAGACQKTLEVFRANKDTQLAVLARTYAEVLFELHAERSK